MSVKVSVIIPVYNAEKYVAHCIESLLNQTLKECEFIFINDGSIDDSPKIIERYKNLDSRIRVINQNNQGVSIARNKGLEIATGEYIGFVDSDDYIEKDMYQILYNSVKKSDCDAIISNLKSEMNGKMTITSYPFSYDTKFERDYIERELLPYLFQNDNLNTAVNKLYRRKIINDNQVNFPEKVALGEDGMFNIRFFCIAKTFKYINYSGYHYREVIGSATRNISQKDYFNRALEVYNFVIPEIQGKIDGEKLKQFKSIKLIRNVMSYIHVYFTPTNEVIFYKRYKYVKSMLNNKNVREALRIYKIVNKSSLGRYERMVINLISYKLTLGLYLTVGYSRYRNK
ncbi:glycosyltransferase family 2 protein [Metabacillus litoralis]|uniref:Glycosyl transferase family 2 n=1 Tax=Metabacillus litoralis TaxID=152268 RepID=A0A179SV30_9BACI|nr:glycosyltransferase family 2 protein [Metabacillus litoralis]OAS85138.1 glycosyl transferase family 2 [Metabacillus litoralis]